MGSDSASQGRIGPRVDFQLPRIVELRAKLVAFQAPRLRNFESSYAGLKEAVEFAVTTDGPIPARALAPALYVGDVPVAESEPVDENHYRFLGLDVSALPMGAAISFAWAGSPPSEREQTPFVFELEEEGTLRAR